MTTDFQRSLPPLLFITNRQKLGGRIGDQTVTQIMESLAATGGAVLPDYSVDSITSSTLKPIRDILSSRPDIVGVVLLGGYDVIAPQTVDCLPTDLRQRISTVLEPDNYVVWSDDAYSSRDDSYLPTLPVSRVPDGGSADFIKGCLFRAPAVGINPLRVGLRNVKRPLADAVYEKLPGTGRMYVSSPVVSGDMSGHVVGQNVYIWLHGEWFDGKQFYGESSGADGSKQLIEALTVSSIIPGQTRNVLACACWGALLADTSAARMSGPFNSLMTNNSIALTFLAQGGCTYIGCTGAHYYPNGVPLHDAFWAQILGGQPASKAIFDAKVSFLKGIPHGNEGDMQLAIELKVWREFTCLGLGW
jgi:hypothetical protein